MKPAPIGARIEAGIERSGRIVPPGGVHSRRAALEQRRQCGEGEGR
jgi:hypothetical protein